MKPRAKSLIIGLFHSIAPFALSLYSAHRAGLYTLDSAQQLWTLVALYATAWGFFWLGWLLRKSRHK